MPSSPKNILIIRLSAIGDLVMASVLVAGLRELYPHARLVWLVQSENAELLRLHADLDEVLVWPRKHWRQLRQDGHWLVLAKAIWTFIGLLRQQGFDLALDIHGLIKSAIWARLSGARRRIGINPREGSGFFLTEALIEPRDDVRIGSEYLGLLRYLGLPHADLKPSLPITDALKSRAKSLLARIGVTGPFIVICPFTTRPQKHWFDDRWRAVIADLSARWPGNLIVLGGPGDLPAAAELLKNAPAARSLVGKTSLPEALAVISLARLSIGVDTGLTHMALACQTPTLALFGATRPYLETGLAQSKVLYDARPCSPCRRRPICDGRFDCMLSITPPRVRDAALELLAAGTQAS